MNEIKEIGGTEYVLKYFPTTKGLQILTRMQNNGFSAEVIEEVIIGGCSIGSVAMDKKKFDSQFRGKYAELMELFAEILKYNKMFPEEEDESGNEDVSEE